MKTKTIAFILLAGLLTLFTAPVYAQGVPPLPHAFYGTVKINGSPAPVGAEVEVRGEGVQTGVGGNPIVTAVVGIYGTSNPLEPKLVAQGDIADGAILTFYVNGVSTGQTAEWHSGEVTEINLTVSIPPGTTETPPPGTTETPPPGATLKPAAFSLSSLITSPSEVSLGESVTISVEVANTGEEAGNYKVTLKIDGVVEANREILVNAGAGQKVTFTTARDLAGTYAVDINGLSGIFMVMGEASSPPAPPALPTAPALPAPPTAPALPAPPTAPAPQAPPTAPAEPVNWPVSWGVMGGVIVVGLIILLVARRKAY